MVLRLGLFAACLLIWLVALLPLKAVAIAAGGAEQLGYRDVFGSAWNGRVYGLRIEGEPVREIGVRLSPLGLVTGHIDARLSADDPSLRGEGRIRWNGRRLRAHEVSGALALSRLPVESNGLLDPDATVFVRLSELDLDLDGMECRAAAGQVSTAALTGLGRSYGVEAPRLEGELTCRDGALVLTAAGETGDMRIEGEIVFGATGHDWTVFATSPHAAVREAFGLAGLAREGDVWHGSGHESLDASR